MISVPIFVIALIVAVLIGFFGGWKISKELKEPATDGYLEVSETDTSQIHTLDIRTPPEQMKNQTGIFLKIRKIPSNSEASQR